MVVVVISSRIDSIYVMWVCSMMLMVIVVRLVVMIICGSMMSFMLLMRFSVLVS